MPIYGKEVDEWSLKQIPNQIEKGHIKSVSPKSVINHYSVFPQEVPLWSRMNTGAIGAALGIYKLQSWVCLESFLVSTSSH